MLFRRLLRNCTEIILPLRCEFRELSCLSFNSSSCQSSSSNSPMEETECQDQRFVSGSDGRKAFTVVVEGNIGSGKSTFLNHFRPSPFIEILEEPLAEWRDVGGHNILEMMYQDLNRNGYLAQSFMQLSRVRMHLKRTEKPIKLMERSVFSNRYCFTEMWRQQKKIRDAELCVLEEWFEFFEQKMDVNVDLIVYLKTEPDVVFRRLLERKRKEEAGVSIEYLKDLHNAYENWLVRRTVGRVPCPVMTLDASKALEDLKNDYQQVWNHAKGRENIEGFPSIDAIAVGESS